MSKLHAAILLNGRLNIKYRAGGRGLGRLWCLPSLPSSGSSRCQVLYELDSVSRGARRAPSVLLLDEMNYILCSSIIMRVVTFYNIRTMIF